MRADRTIQSVSALQRIDEELLSDARVGDGEALAVLFDRHRDRVYRHVYRSAASVEEAQDITAMVFFEMWRKRSSARSVDGSIVPWLLVVATNIARNSARSRRRYATLLARIPSPSVQPDHAPEVLERVEMSARANEVNVAFRRLSKRDQEVLTLCVLEELSVAEAAVALNVPAGTVKSRLSRAKARLAAALPDPNSFAAPTVN